MYARKGPSKLKEPSVLFPLYTCARRSSMKRRTQNKRFRSCLVNCLNGGWCVLSSGFGTNLLQTCCESTGRRTLTSTEIGRRSSGLFGCLVRSTCAASCLRGSMGSRVPSLPAGVLLWALSWKSPLVVTLLLGPEVTGRRRRASRDCLSTTDLLVVSCSHEQKRPCHCQRCVETQYRPGGASHAEALSGPHSRTSQVGC